MSATAVEGTTRIKEESMSSLVVIPAKAGIQRLFERLGARFAAQGCANFARAQVPHRDVSMSRARRKRAERRARSDRGHDVEHGRLGREGWVIGAILASAMVCAGALAAEEDMKGMNHDAGPPLMQGGPPPPDARDPHAYSDGYDFGPIARPRMGDEHNFGSVLIDRLESVRANSNTSAAYDIQAWFGTDYDRVVLKAEGDYDEGKIEDARTELLWGHAVSAYWNRQIGVRHDSGVGPDRDWIAFGFQGLAPYWFEVDAAVYVGEGGRTALRAEVEYELLFTQKLVLQPRAEVNVYGKRDVERELGSGISDVSVGVRLRYEIRREFAPYVGIERVATFGQTADFARAAGVETQQTRLVAGVRAWF